MIILEGKGLTKKYRTQKGELTALDAVDLRLEKGEILGIAGESGSGKTTLLKLISSLEAPTKGELFLNGKKLSMHRTKEDYRAMQMIFQDATASFHPRRSIADSIRESVRSLCGKNRDGAGQKEADMDRLCAMVGLKPELAERLPKNLSGGQCQRFAIARAMAVQPSILLCDEVTSALDVSSQAQILALIETICRDNNMSAIFVSHDLAVISSLCDRVVILREGRVEEEGAVRQIIDSPQKEYTQRLLGSVLEL
ncbi:MAG: ABC transporter ATP-binding protein [Lachnospiraceae bacterium]|nr:ABC transporter ATP-binding protein [Lachnospiraceae bacterium]